MRYGSARLRTRLRNTNGKTSCEVDDAAAVDGGACLKPKRGGARRSRTCSERTRTNCAEVFESACGLSSTLITISRPTAVRTRRSLENRSSPRRILVRTSCELRDAEEETCANAQYTSAAARHTAYKNRHDENVQRAAGGWQGSARHKRWWRNVNAVRRRQERVRGGGYLALGSLIAGGRLHTRAARGGVGVAPCEVIIARSEDAGGGRRVALLVCRDGRDVLHRGKRCRGWDEAWGGRHRGDGWIVEQ